MSRTKDHLLKQQEEQIAQLDKEFEEMQNDIGHQRWLDAQEKQMEQERLEQVEDDKDTFWEEFDKRYEDLMLNKEPWPEEERNKCVVSVNVLEV